MMVAALLSSGEGIGRHGFWFGDCCCFFCGAQEVQWAVSVHTRTQGEGMVGKGGRARGQKGEGGGGDESFVYGLDDGRNGVRNGPRRVFAFLR